MGGPPAQDEAAAEEPARALVAEVDDADIAAGGVNLLFGHGVGLVEIQGTGNHDPNVRCGAAQDSGRGEHLGITLLAHQAADDSAHHGVRTDAPRAPRRGDVVRVDRATVEALEVDAVAQQAQLGARDPQRGQRLDVLGVLHQLDVGAASRHPLQGVHERPSPPAVAGLGVETVDGVDHRRHAGHAGGQAAVDPGLGVVGVYERGPETAELGPQFRQRAEVAVRSHRPGGVLEGHMLDADGGQRGDERSGGGEADDVIPGGDERLELRSEQQSQADVRCRHVDDARSVHGIDDGDGDGPGRNRMSVRRMSSSARMPPASFRWK